MKAERLLYSLPLALAMGCRQSPPFRVMPPESLRTHYLFVLEDTHDSTRLFATLPHLIVFNPGARDAELMVTAYYEAHDPDRSTSRGGRGREQPVESLAVTGSARRLPRAQDRERCAGDLPGHAGMDEHRGRLRLACGHQVA